MVVTRTSAEKLRKRARHRRGRGLETLLLGIVTLFWLIGVIKLYDAFEASFDEAERQLSAGAIVNLNRVFQPEMLTPLLESIPASERQFVARKILHYRNRAGAGNLDNVGELSRIVVTSAEVGAEDDLTSFQERLEKATAAGNEQPKLRLLTQSQIASFKSKFIVRAPQDFQTAFRNYALLIALGVFAVHLVWYRFGVTSDQWILPCLFALIGLGYLQMVSIRDPLRDLMIFQGFAQGAAAGCVLLLIISRLDFRVRLWRRLSFPFLGLAIALSTALIFFGSGPGTSDAKVNLFGFQPIEAIKLLLVLFLAGYFCDRWEFLRELRERRSRWARVLRLPKLEYMLPVVAAMALVLVFFFLQRDMGPALVMSLLFLGLYGVARGGPGLALFGLAIMVAGFYGGYRLGVPRTVVSRIEMWLDPWQNAFAGGDHLAKTLWSLATGALTGVGLGHGDAEFVPAVHTDMILAAIGEELGFIGLSLVLLLFGFLATRFLRITLATDDSYSFFLSLGLTLVATLQILLIAGGVLGLVPLSGIATPFLSFGRSSMLANFAIVGVLMAIAQRSDTYTGAIRPLQRSARWLILPIGIALSASLAAAAKIQVVDADRLLIRGNLALQADGLRRYQYNPRLVRVARGIPRGSIVDRNGFPLATGDRRELAPHRQTLEELGVTLDQMQEPSKRFYPLGGLTYHLLGDLRRRLNWAAPNTSLVERDARIRLQGYDDYAQVVSIQQPNNQTSTVVTRDYRELIPLLRHGHDPGHPEVTRIRDADRTVRMTIDAKLQVQVAEILARYTRQADSERGAAVVLDTATGDLLASVSHPSPASLPPKSGDASERDRLFDRARYGIYPPGSSFKLVSAIAALNRAPELRDATFRCEALGGGRVGHKVRGWGKPIRDDRLATSPHGDVDLRKGIRHSCNAYFAQLVTYEVGAGALLETAGLFGIEVAAPNTAEALQDALPQAAFGQGQVTATPFKMARVAATVANGGVMPQGRWLLGDSNTRTLRPSRILAAEDAELLALAMRETVTRGSGKVLNGVTPPIAGKTGTAEVAGKGSHAWFVGFAPYDEPGPTVAFAVLIEHGGYGGRQAARAAGEIVERAALLGLIGPSGASKQ